MSVEGYLELLKMYWLIWKSCHLVLSLGWGRICIKLRGTCLKKFTDKIVKSCKQIERKRELKRRGLRRRRKRRCESWVLSGDSRANLKIKHCIFTHWQLWLFNFSHVSDDTLDSQSRRFDHYFDISKECLSHIHELSNVCYPSSFLWPKCQSLVQCSSPFTNYI